VKRNDNNDAMVLWKPTGLRSCRSLRYTLLQKHTAKVSSLWLCT